MTTINLGCGNKKLLNAINVDKSPLVKPDLLVDFETGELPFESNSADCIGAEHVLEHIKNLIPFMNECYRVLKQGGVMSIVVPQGDGMWADPTHVRAFSKLSFRYYCGYGSPEVSGIKAKFRQMDWHIKDNEDGGQLTVVLTK